ncbi:MAG: serine/threonine-protein kinase [Elusimicrobiota bacterium]|jgi:hypothetical protein
MERCFLREIPPDRAGQWFLAGVRGRRAALGALLALLLLAVLPCLRAASSDRDWKRRAQDVRAQLSPDEDRRFMLVLRSAPPQRIVPPLVRLTERILMLRELRDNYRSSMPRAQYERQREDVCRDIDGILRGTDEDLLPRLVSPMMGMLEDAGYPIRERLPRPGSGPEGEPGPGVVMDLKSSPAAANFERAEYAPRPPRELLSQPILSAAAVPQPSVAVDREPERRPGKPGPPGGLPLLLGVLALPFVALFLLRKRLAAWVVRQGLVEAGTPPPGTPAAPVAPAPALDSSAGTGTPPRIPTGYRIIRRIGAGGMGEVYEAEDLSLERRVAVKRMRGEISQDPREVQRFLAEARTVAKLRHPGIIEIYAVVEREGEVYLVFEYIDGMTLEHALVKRERLTLAQVRAFLRQVCAALSYAHEHGIVHRDLKPANIMLTRESVVKVMDFGIARVGKDALHRLSMTNTVAGTPPYMAPEAETGVVRRESDLFSLAVCLYELLTGERPYAGTGAGMLFNKMNALYEPPTRRVPGLPPGLDAFFIAALNPDPEKRPHTAAEFLAAFESAAGL